MARVDADVIAKSVLLPVFLGAEGWRPADWFHEFVATLTPEQDAKFEEAIKVIDETSALIFKQWDADRARQSDLAVAERDRKWAIDVLLGKGQGANDDGSYSDAQINSARKILEA